MRERLFRKSGEALAYPFEALEMDSASNLCLSTFTIEQFSPLRMLTSWLMLYQLARNVEKAPAERDALLTGVRRINIRPDKIPY